ncbi:MAG: hypothetical protein RIG61_11090 [Deltaproteobacteria bacterium]
MAEFLDKLKGKIDKGLSTVNVKSKELIERQKIKLHLSELEAEKKMILQDLGKLTYGYFEASGGIDLIIPHGSSKASPAVPESLDKWEESVLTVLKRVSGGELGNILFEDTPKQFKVTAKALYDEVEKLIPKSEKKGQNLQWLGRVLGKFGLTAKKVSKRIDGDRETVYVFDKQKTDSILSGLLEGGEKTGATGKKTDRAADTAGILTKCKKIKELDSKIAKLETQLQNIGEKS